MVIWLVVFRRQTVTALDCMGEAFTESDPELLTDTPTNTLCNHPQKRHCGMMYTWI